MSILDPEMIKKLESKGIDYTLGLDRFGDNEDLLITFMLRYLESEHIDKLEDALRAQDVDQAYYQAHSLRGLVGNLSFTEFYDAASALSDSLRKGALDEADDLMPPIKVAHNRVVEALMELREHTKSPPSAS